MIDSLFHSIAWTTVLACLGLWHFLRPLLDPRSYLCIAISVGVTLFPSCLTFNTVSFQCLPHFFIWGLIHFFLFRRELPVTFLEQREDHDRPMPIFLVTITLIVTALFYHQWASLIPLIPLPCGANYLRNRLKCLITSVLVSGLFSTSILQTSGMNNTEMVYLLVVSVVMYCYTERALNIIETWPDLYGEKGVSSIRQLLCLSIFTLDEELPQDDIDALRKVMWVVSHPWNITTWLGYLTCCVGLPYGMRTILSTIGLFFKYIDDFVDNRSIPKMEKVRQITLIRQLVGEIYKGAKKDLDLPYAPWIRTKGWTPRKIDWDFYTKEISCLTPEVMRCVLLISNDIPPQALLDKLEGFEWEAKDGEINTEDDLHRYISRVAEPVVIFYVVAALKKFYLHPVPIGKDAYDKILRYARASGLYRQLLHIALDIAEDSKEGKLFIPKEWLEYEEHYEILKVKRDPWSLDNQTLKMYSNLILQHASKFRDEALNAAIAAFDILPTPYQKGGFFSQNVHVAIHKRMEKAKSFCTSPSGNVPWTIVIMLGIRYMYFPFKTSYGWIA